MLKISDNTIVYVLAPIGVVTGGAELLHQLVSALRDDNIDARIVYFEEKATDCPLDYKKYNLKYDTDIVDDSKNILVLYEGIFEKHKTYKHIQKVFWWLSVDNFFLCETPFLPLTDIYRYRDISVKRILKERLTSKKSLHDFLNSYISIRSLRREKAINAYQSEYAHHFLADCHFTELYPLKDFINDEHFLGFDISKKEDIVLYNPKKGYSFTKRIIKASPQIKFIPIINMARSEVIDLIKRAKVYIDFGYHPGKDRLPRECAMNGCCIITGKRGSAAYKEDVNIPDSYKFNETDSLSDIVTKIEYCMNEYEDAIKDFETYRGCVINEKQEFFTQVRILFAKV